MEAQTFMFASSPFVPVAIGFFGLGTGYFIWGGQALFGFPKTSPEVNRSLGLGGFWMPGFMQFLTGIYLLTGLTWFNVFSKAAPLYMAGLAFTAYGIHWFAMAHRRYIDSTAQLDGWMAIAFLFLSILGVDVFRRSGDIPVMIIFVGLTLIYATEVPTRLLSWNSDYDILGDLQRGSYSNDSIHAGAGIVKVAHLFDSLPWKPRLGGEYDYATGNPHQNPNRISTYDQ
jgi:hypothetical protein